MDPGACEECCSDAGHDIYYAFRRCGMDLDCSCNRIFTCKKMRRTGVLMTCSLLGSLIVNNLILKNLVARTRPYEAVDGLQRIIEAQRDLSFPSGHTGSSFAAAVVIFLTCPGKIRGAGFDPGISGSCFQDFMSECIIRRTFLPE